ncbi:MAG: hypothetical protein WCS04_07720, partial [Sphaerochaetaceae bacterium]
QAQAAENEEEEYHNPVQQETVQVHNNAPQQAPNVQLPGIFTIQMVPAIVELMTNRYGALANICENISKVENIDGVLVITAPKNFYIQKMRAQEKIVRAAIAKISGYRGPLRYELEKKVEEKVKAPRERDEFLDEAVKMFRGKLAED